MIAPVRRSPLAAAQSELGASLSQEAGWEIAAAYEDEGVEAERLRGSIGVADITPRAKIDVHGALEDALAAAGDALAGRLSDEWALVLGSPGEEEVLLPKMTAAAGPATMVTDATHLFAGLAIAGPANAEALARLTSWDPDTLRPGRATGAPIADVRAVLFRRDLEVPVLEAYVTTEYARYVWEVVLDVARRLGGGPVGWRALRAKGWS